MFLVGTEIWWVLELVRVGQIEWQNDLLEPVLSHQQGMRDCVIYKRSDYKWSYISSSRACYVMNALHNILLYSQSVSSTQEFHRLKEELSIPVWLYLLWFLLCCLYSCHCWNYYANQVNLQLSSTSICRIYNIEYIVIFQA